MDLTPDLLKIDPEKVSQQLERFIKTSMDSLNRDGAVIGLRRRNRYGAQKRGTDCASG